ncbi:MAG: hypothetical protein Kow0068_02660 [Marinilabiliales bacterium]
MKTLFLTALCGIFMLISCQKEELTINQLSESNYVFKNPKWKLVNSNYQNDDGNVGNLYVNENNPIETLFEPITILKENNNDFTGTFSKKFENGQLIGYICQPPANDCKVNIQYDGDGNIIGVKITVKNK